jgi:glycosidase
MSSHRFIRFLLLTAIALVSVSLKIKADADLSGATARPSPDWLRSGTVYEIFPRDFSAEGNLNGVTARLDELKELGVNVLWIMPIQPIGEKGRKGQYGSPYAIQDYYAVNPDYGTLEDFKRLVAEAHRRGLKVILDLVANHTAWDNVLIQPPVAKSLQAPHAQGKNTAHPDFYKHDAEGNIISPDPGWTDVAGLNYTNQELRAYMIAVMKYWVQTCDIDGYRCDVAWGVPTDFWEQARTELEKIKPDIMMLAESEKPELLVKAFDLDYDWSLLHAMDRVLTEGAPASELQKSWQESRTRYPKDALRMRISDDHDEARAVARYDIRGALAASALMFTLDGVPLLYNGMEVGDATESGDPALFDKLPIVWHPRQRPPLREIYRGLINLRKQYPCFETGRVEWLRNSDETNLVSLTRTDDRDEFLVVINFSNRPLQATIEMKDAQGYSPVKIPGLESSNGGALPSIHLNGFEWRIYHRRLAN